MTESPHDTRAVFAYGTLRPGGDLHWLIADRVISHHSATLEGFDLHGVGRPFPKIVERHGATVHGDVLHFDPDTWADTFAHLCQIEGVPSLYTAEIVVIDGESVTVFVPTRPDDWGGVIDTGDWFTEVARQTAVAYEDSDELGGWWV